jgi:hypothetical protein
MNLKEGMKKEKRLCLKKNIPRGISQKGFRLFNMIIIYIC